MKAASFLVTLLLCSVGGTAWAQSAEAEVLFREGKKLLKDGKIAEACEKLEASARIEPTVGSLLNLADCRERNGQIASAWATFGRAASTARLGRDTQRESEARRREKLLESRLSYMTIAVDDPVEGITIKRNDAEVDRAVWNQSLPIDPGEYEISAEAPEHATWMKTVKVGEGKKVTVKVPELEESDGSEPPAQTDEDNEDQPARPSRWTGKRKVAVVTAILGLGAGGAGVAFALRGKGLQEDSDAICPTSACNDDEALSLNSRARKSALYANIGFATGGALVATSVVLWIVGAPADVTPVVTEEQVGLAFGGTF
jgi:hypothetical protein